MKKRKPEVQIEAMRHWFGENYDPPHGLPYDSSEGGYEWIWGGPYDPWSLLRSRFSDHLPPKVIDQLGSELLDISTEWSGKSHGSGIYEDDYISEMIASGTDPFMTLLGSLSEIENAANINAPADQKKVLHKLLFAKIVSALETFLSDLFIKTLGRSDKHVEDFVFKTPHFRETQIKLSSIFERFKKIDAEVSGYALSHNWHMLTESGLMYKRAFNLKFPEVPETIQNGIRDRHDIVHRNGKTSEGVLGSWGLANVLALKEAVLAFAGELNDKVLKLSEWKPPAPGDPIEI